MDGTLSVDSCVGGGSTFTICVPIGTVEAPAQASGPWPACLTDADVVILDNNPLSSRMIAAALAGQVGTVRCINVAQASGEQDVLRAHHLIADAKSLGGEVHNWISAALGKVPGMHLTLLCDQTIVVPEANGRVTVLTRPFAADELLRGLVSRHPAALAA